MAETTDSDNGMSLTRSIDHLILEKYSNESGDFMRITRYGQTGNRLPEITFRVGDSAGAAGFLSQLSELFGTGEITIKGKP